MKTTIKSNKVRLIMIQHINTKVVTDGDATIYRLGNTIVDDKGNLVTGSDVTLWEAYRLSN